jgi:polysaccharide export outer membrane protein
MKKSNNYFNYCIGLGLMLILILNSCTSPKSTNLLQQKKPIYTAKPFQDYKLQYNDEITCSILTSNKDFSDVFNGVISNTPGASAAYTIFETGNISIPFFGNIHIVGLTIPEAEDIIQSRMRQAIPDAQVKVILKNNFYYIVSESQNGKQEIYKDNMTIFQALAVSGEPNKRLDINNVKIIRTDESGKSIIKSFDLRSESIIESEFYYLKPNDMIYYSTSKRAFFQIDSFTSVFSVILAPVSLVFSVLALTDKL